MHNREYNPIFRCSQKGDLNHMADIEKEEVCHLDAEEVTKWQHLISHLFIFIYIYIYIYIYIVQQYREDFGMLQICWPVALPITKQTVTA